MSRLTLSLLVAVSIMLVSAFLFLAGRFGQEVNTYDANRPRHLLTLTLLAVISLALAVGTAMYFLHHVLLLHKAYWLVPVFGALGGLVGCLIRHDNCLPLVHFEKEGSSIRMGFVGDMILGLGGAAAIIFLFDSALVFAPEKIETYPLLVSICFIAGVFGRPVVERAGKHMIQEALDTAKDAKKQVAELHQPSSMAYLLAARQQFAEGRYQEALETTNKALQIDPNSVRSLNTKARALRKLDRIQEALDVIEIALNVPQGQTKSSQENYGALLYNKTCYQLLLGSIQQDQAISQLKRSFELWNRTKADAKTDPDLAILRQNEDFRHLLE